MESTPIQEIRCFVQYNPIRNASDLYIVGIDSYGRRWIAEPVNLVFTLDAHDKPLDPTLSFVHHHATQFLQTLADGLAESGFLPKLTEKMQGELGAIKYHLEDMRILVFKEKK
jgi:hypothetical protein